MTMMNEVLYERMCEHIGHRIEIASYASRENVAVECVTCGCVIVDVNRPKQRVTVQVTGPDCWAYVKFDRRPSALVHYALIEAGFVAWKPTAYVGYEQEIPAIVREMQKESDNV